MKEVFKNLVVTVILIGAGEAIAVNPQVLYSISVTPTYQIGEPQIGESVISFTNSDQLDGAAVFRDEDGNETRVATSDEFTSASRPRISNDLRTWNFYLTTAWTQTLLPVVTKALGKIEPVLSVHINPIPETLIFTNRQNLGNDWHPTGVGVFNRRHGASTLKKLIVQAKTVAGTTRDYYLTIDFKGKKDLDAPDPEDQQEPKGLID